MQQPNDPLVTNHLADFLPHKLSKTVEVELYRVAIEALNNIVKHANAYEVTVRMVRKFLLRLISLMADIIRILVADDHMVVRQGLCSLLIGRNGMDVVGEAAVGIEAVELAPKLNSA